MGVPEIMENENLEIVDTSPRSSGRGYFFAGLTIGLLIALSVFFIMATRLNEYKKAGGDIIDLATIRKMALISDVIDNHFYPYNEDQDTSLENRRTGMYKGMVYALNDVYADYYTAEELKEALADSKGVYYGIGAYISFDEKRNYPVFSGVMEGTPAEEAGIHAGDVIVEVDGESVYGYTSTETANVVRGEAGTVVHLKLFREGEDDYLEMDITRAEVASISVGSKMLENDIGYIAISSFELNSVDQFKKEYQELKDDGAKALIVDLRSNPGGAVASVVEILRQILPEGLIYYEENSAGVRREEYCDGANEIQIPLVVLVNQYSASAAEIFAGAVRDYEIGTLVGIKTYGKGIVQDTIPLSDGSAVKLTSSSYFSPKGYNFQGIGIEPDVEVEFDSKKYYDKGEDTQLNKAVEVIKEKIK